MRNVPVRILLLLYHAVVLFQAPPPRVYKFECSSSWASESGVSAVGSFPLMRPWTFAAALGLFPPSAPESRQSKAGYVGRLYNVRARYGGRRPPKDVAVCHVVPSAIADRWNYAADRFSSFSVQLQCW
ncbi:hypothetical protein LY76DRAFT_603526 [Colletotrichum caudatum]|nr:hypothetical protein LY76DRAFT_603526 [Colletotrichum caudatum]